MKLISLHTPIWIRNPHYGRNYFCQAAALISRNIDEGNMAHPATDFPMIMIKVHGFIECDQDPSDGGQSEPFTTFDVVVDAENIASIQDLNP